MKNDNDIVQHDETVMSYAMLQAAEILSSDASASMTFEEIAAHVGTSARSLQRWRQTPVFIQYVKQRTLENSLQDLPQILGVLTAKAKKGESVRWVEAWLKTMGIMSSDFTIRPAPTEDTRSNAAIIAEIERLHAKAAKNHENIIDMEEL